MTNWYTEQVRVNPYRSMADFFDRDPIASANTPRANVIRTKSGYTVELELPSFSRSEIDIQAKNGSLVVTAKRESTDTKVEYVSREFNTTSLTRGWTLPKDVNVDAIDASYDAGVLSITFPLKTTSDTSARRIEIR